MAGYLAKSATNTDGLSKEALLYCKTNIGGYFFDGFLSVKHEKKTVITSNPVESGASIVDHAYVEPAVLTMSIIVSDAHTSIIPEQFQGSSKFRHVNAWNILKQLQQDRIPCSVLTKLDLYNNMLIESISAEDTDETYNALRADVVLKEIPIARVRTVKISAADQTTIGTQMSNIQAEGANIELTSLLYSLFAGNS